MIYFFHEKEEKHLDVFFQDSSLAAACHKNFSIKFQGETQLKTLTTEAKTEIAKMRWVELAYWEFSPMKICEV